MTYVDKIYLLFFLLGIFFSFILGWNLNSLIIEYKINKISDWINNSIQKEQENMTKNENINRYAYWSSQIKKDIYNQILKKINKI